MTIPNCLSIAPGILAAELTINGLALCCFNHIDPNNKFWEVAYPRNRRHVLIISIEFADGSIQSYTIPPDKELFTIRLSTGTNDLYQNFPQGGCQTGNFNRTGAGNDPNDLRWMIDVAGPEADHGTVTLKPKGGGRVGVTLARLQHSLLFTVRPSAHPVRFIPVGSGDPATHGFELGPTNREMGALMMAPTAGRIIFEGDGINIPPLDFNANTSYKISIINEDQYQTEHWPGYVKGDFHLLYEVITVTGERKELWAVPDVFVPLVTADGDCNPNGFGGSTLQPLIA